MRTAVLALALCALFAPAALAGSAINVTASPPPAAVASPPPPAAVASPPPVAVASPPPAAVASPPPAAFPPPPAVQKLAAGECIKHTVVSGDDVYSLATKYGTTVEGVVAFNPAIAANPAALTVGDSLTICGAGTQAPPTASPPSPPPTESPPPVASPPPPSPPPPPFVEPIDSLVALLESRNDTTLLLELIEAANLTAILDDPSLNATLFAPTDKAILGLLTALNVSADAVLAQQGLLVDLLKYHLLPGAVYSDEITPKMDGRKFPTYLKNEALALYWPPSAVAAKNGPQLNTTTGQIVPIMEYDLEAGASVVHLVPQVLLPTTVYNKVAAGALRG